jgi:hypothetical protein
MRAFAVDGRDRAAEADRLRSHVIARLRVRVGRHPVQKVEGGQVNAADGPGDDVLARLLDASREELEGKTERGRPGIGRVDGGKSKPKIARDLFDLVCPRDLAPERSR